MLTFTVAFLLILLSIVRIFVLQTRLYTKLKTANQCKEMCSTVHQSGVRPVVMCSVYFPGLRPFSCLFSVLTDLLQLSWLTLRSVLKALQSMVLIYISDQWTRIGPIIPEVQFNNDYFLLSIYMYMYYYICNAFIACKVQSSRMKNDDGSQLYLP